MRVDHGRAHVAVAKEFLDRADVVTILEQVNRERMPQRVVGRGPRKSGADRGFTDGSLEHGFVRVVPAPPPALPIDVEAHRRKDPLPAPLEGGARVLAIERQRQLDAAEAASRARFRPATAVRGRARRGKGTAAR